MNKAGEEEHPQEELQKESNRIPGPEFCRIPTRPPDTTCMGVTGIFWCVHGRLGRPTSTPKVVNMTQTEHQVNKSSD